MRKIKLLVVFIILFLLFAVYDFYQQKLIYNKEVNKEINVEDSFIDAKGENNPEIISKYFATGISKEDYINIIERKTEVLKETDSYKKMSYNFEEYLKYSELESIYKNLNNSKIVKTEVIGISVDERKIYSLEIGNGDETVLFEAGIHASEFSNPLFIIKFMIDLVNKYEENDKEITELLNKYKIVILPNVNPDGYDVAIFGTKMLKNKKLYTYNNKDKIDFHYFKANANGIDLNRNMPSQNGGLYYKKYELNNTVSLLLSTERNRYYAGKVLGSEPETKALIYWQNKYLKDTYAYISFHSSGRVIFNVKPNLSDEFNNLNNNCAKIVNKITEYEILEASDEEVGEGNDGTSTDFMAELANGFNYSSKTGRLSTISYDSKTNELKYKLCVITIETLERYTKDLGLIKDEYIDYELEKVFLNLIKQ